MVPAPSRRGVSEQGAPPVPQGWLSGREMVTCPVPSGDTVMSPQVAFPVNPGGFLDRSTGYGEGLGECALAGGDVVAELDPELELRSVMLVGHVGELACQDLRLWPVDELDPCPLSCRWPSSLAPPAVVPAARGRMSRWRSSAPGPLSTG